MRRRRRRRRAVAAYIIFNFPFNGFICVHPGADWRAVRALCGAAHSIECQLNKAMEKSTKSQANLRGKLTIKYPAPHMVKKIINLY